mgnify:CR=1 FL=1
MNASSGFTCRCWRAISARERRDLDRVRPERLELLPRHAGAERVPHLHAEREVAHRREAEQQDRPGNRRDLAGLAEEGAVREPQERAP